MSELSAIRSDPDAWWNALLDALEGGRAAASVAFTWDVLDKGAWPFTASVAVTRLLRDPARAARRAAACSLNPTRTAWP